jgi:hypothetical protein
MYSMKQPRKSLVPSTRLHIVKHKRNNPHNKLYRLAPMPVSQAIRTQACRVASFLSQGDIDRVLRQVRKLDLPSYTSNPEQDISTTGAPVHTTAYLNTNGKFSDKFIWLKEKILSEVHRINAQERWGFDTMSPHLNVRVAEYHEMDVGGSLNDPHHYDIGSLITVDIMLEGMYFNTVSLYKFIMIKHTHVDKF